MVDVESYLQAIPSVVHIVAFGEVYEGTKIRVAAREIVSVL